MPEYSPALSILTAAFELAVAIWTLRSPGRREILRSVAGILFFLAGYQLIEVFVCSDPSDLRLAQLAFADVIWLPPLGAWLVAQLAAPDNPRVKRLAQLGFVGAGALVAWVVLDPGSVSQSVCQVFFARYINPSPVYKLYGLFYQLGLFVMMFGGVATAARVQSATDRRHLADVAMGTIGFVVPSLLLEIVYRPALGAMPSVMCHFALVLALFLTRLVQRERQVAMENTVAN